MKLLLLLIIVIIKFTPCYGNDLLYQYKDVGIDNKIGAIIDKNITLSDEFDNEVNLLDIINGQPTIINFVYLNCPLLCHLLLDGIVDVAQRSQYKLEKDYQIITISIDNNETNTNLIEHKKKYLEQMNVQNGWMFLKGNKVNIDKLTENFGYNFKYIKRTKDYAHPSALFFYNKKLTNYVDGVTFEKTTYDYSIMQIKNNTSIKEKIINYCYYYDPENQTYSLLIFKIVRIACLLTVIILSIIIVNLLLKERRVKKYGK